MRFKCLEKQEFVFENVENCRIQLRIGVTVPASYGEYTALVKSGNVASKHVNGWRVRSKRQI